MNYFLKSLLFLYALIYLFEFVMCLFDKVPIISLLTQTIAFIIFIVSIVFYVKNGKKG